MYFLARWLINIIALFVVIHMVAGVSTENWQATVVAALIIGLLNAFLRPIMLLVTLPLSILTFGFFTLIINAFVFYLAAKFVKGFVVASFASAFWAALLFSIISFILNTMLKPGATFRMSYFRSDPPKRQEYTGVIDVEARVEEDEKTDDKLKLKGGGE